MELEKLDGTGILSDDVFEWIFETADPVEKSNRIIAARERAVALRKTRNFDMKLRANERALKEAVKEKAAEDEIIRTQERRTQFSDLPEGYSQMACGIWTAEDSGVWMFAKDFIRVYACPHPIIPVERMKNLQTGFEKIKLLYKRDFAWHEKIFSKEVVSSSNKIVALSNYGILVTTENAKALVKYLSDVEARSSDEIPVKHSSSKFGWIDGGFIPYDTDIEFDGENQFAQLAESIRERGSYDAWIECIKGIRRSGGFQVRMMMAASFASVLLEYVNALPFFVDLWGDTEGGKTVTLMVAASIWADPSESKYIGDFKSTEVALETKANALNNLPMILDDTSKTSKGVRENFEGFVYDMASGKGKSRSNKDLGVRYESNWKLAILTSGEAPLMGYVNQGGAINRILEVKADSKLFEDPQGAVETVKANYGFAGRRFVEAVKGLGRDAVYEIFQSMQRDILSVCEEKMQKQVISLAVLLTADRIATDSIFQDGIHLDTEEAIGLLVDPDELSINERAYQFLLEKVAMNPGRFDKDNDKAEQWGVMEGDCVCIIGQAFRQLCQEGRFSEKSFLDWAVKRGIVETDRKGNPKKLKKVNGKPSRYVFLKCQEDDFDYTYGEDIPFE